jgi:D-alanyl-lipoteichoic acid acyltransferase DltB (MBOAT superfamily)
MSYIIEFYYGRQKPEKHLGIYALYVMFYPQLVAGPIERPQNMLHQFHKRKEFNADRAAEGIRLMSWGVLKKVVVADNLAFIVDSVYKNPQVHTGITLALATYLFAFQIYCDFSGYTDIARGAARVMGFELMENFKRPYFSKSISEFWRRWHISLSSWFRDYVYIPLDGSRGGTWKWYRNLMVVFILSGLWHGASWNYVIWGALNGFYLVCSSLTQRFREKLSSFLGLDGSPKIQKFIRVFITFNLISFTWIFFRAGSLAQAKYIVKKVFTDFGLKVSFDLAGITRFELLFCALAIGILLAVQLLQRAKSMDQRISNMKSPVRWGIYYAGVLILLIFGAFTKNSFIYFQF